MLRFCLVEIRMECVFVTFKESTELIESLGALAFPRKQLNYSAEIHLNKNFQKDICLCNSSPSSEVQRLNSLSLQIRDAGVDVFVPRL